MTNFVITQRTETIVCRIHDAYCRRVGYHYDWEILEESPGFDCQPLDVNKIEQWRDAIADELKTTDYHRINATFIKELGWLKYLYIDFVISPLKCDASLQKQVASWLLEVGKVRESFLIKTVMEREE